MEVALTIPVAMAAQDDFRISGKPLSMYFSLYFARKPEFVIAGNI